MYFSRKCLVITRYIAAVAGQQCDERLGIQSLREELNRAIAKGEHGPAIVERVDFGVVGAVHHAIAHDRCVAAAGGVVLYALSIRAVDAKAAVDIGPTPTIGRGTQAKCYVACAWVGRFLARNVHARPTSSFADHGRVAQAIGDGR